MPANLPAPGSRPSHIPLPDRSAPDGTLRTWRVDRRVGSPKNNGAELIKPTEIAM
jgi:hypothetical protein